MSDSNTRIWFALFVLVVFCVGGALGVFVGQRMDGTGRPAAQTGPRASPGPGGRPGAPGGGPPPEVLLERLTRDLALTAAQRAELQVVLRDGRERVGQLQRDARDRFDEEQRRLHAEIRKVLTSEQQERFEKILEHGRRPRGSGRGRGQG